MVSIVPFSRTGGAKRASTFAPAVASIFPPTPILIAFSKYSRECAERFFILYRIPKSKYIYDNIEELCKNILQPLRNHFNKKIRITSGFRSKKLNDKIIN